MLLTALVRAAETQSDPTALLHERVTLHRLDGTAVSGRTAVADAICNHGSEARFRVMASHGETIEMAIEIKGLAGYLRCTLSGLVHQNTLIEIRMNAG